MSEQMVRIRTGRSVVPVVLLMAGLVQALKTPPAELLAQQTNPAVSKSAPFIVAQGLAVEPFAKEQLSNPASIDVDDRGRVWVAEAFNYRKKTRQAGDRILILEDSDGNGRADRSTVFYQNPDIDGVHGVCVLGNRAIVSAPDRILLVTDTDGDDQADEKQVLFVGKVINPVHGQHDHAIHAVMFGPDGRLYFNFGNFNAELRRPDGTLVTDVFGNPVNNSRQPYQEGMVIRCEMDGSRVEVLGHNFRNNWEVTVDSFGSMWQSDNDNELSSCRVNFVMEYGNYGYRDEKTGADYRSRRTNIEATMQRRMWHQNDPGVVPNLLITGSGAPTGILVYEGDLLPEQFHGQMIHAEPGRNRVWAFPAQQAGAGYTARIVDLVRNDVDHDYRPADVSVAPDGSLLIADWFDPVDCCHRTINDAGRIFRVAPPGHAYRVPAYDYQTAEGAVQALQSPNLSARYRAWTALVGMQVNARSALDVLASNPNPRFRARALWALAAIGDGAAQAIETALRDKSADVRLLALRIARRHRLPVEAFVRRLVRDDSAQVRRECAVSLHRLESAESVQLWVELATQYDGHDRWYLEALGIGEKGKEAACLKAWLKRVGTAWKTPAGRDIIWRSRAPQAAPLLAELLQDPQVPTGEHPRLLRALDFHEGELHQVALTTLLQGDAQRHPATYLEAFQRASPEFVQSHPRVMEQVEAALIASKGTVTFVDLVARFKRRDLIGHLMDMVRSGPETEPGIRAADQIIAFNKGSLIGKELADPSRSAPFIKALGFVDNEHSRTYLTGVVTNESQPEATRLLAIAAMGQSAVPARELVRLVEQNKLPKEFLAPAVRALTLSPGPGTRMFAAGKVELLVPAGGRWPLPRLLATTPDITRGFAAFQKGGCIKCHKIGDLGQEFGPALSAIGSKLTSQQLFSAILKPSETISQGYEGVTVVTDQGTLHTGFVITDTKETLTLRIPGGLQKEIPKESIEVRNRSKVSLMPQGIDAVLLPRELVDLVGWLKTQRTGKAQ
ncbi:MAG: dehydrogenase [Planctomycetaceae bacterium]|nr:dehydrogenase [Planctomycetaceae bacterium]